MGNITVCRRECVRGYLVLMWFSAVVILFWGRMFSGRIVKRAHSARVQEGGAARSKGWRLFVRRAVVGGAFCVFCFLLCRVRRE